MRYDQAQDRVADELKRFVVQTARLPLFTRLNLLVGPRAMRNALFKQGAIMKSVAEDFFQRVEIGVSGLLLLHSAGDFRKSRADGRR